MSMIQAPYKTGIYVGKAVEERNGKTLVQVLAVIKHPNQGDLHHPKNVDVPLFHERKALAENEKVWIPSELVQEYDGEVTSYQESLKQSLHELTAKLEKDSSPYAEKALEKLASIKKDYRLT